MTITTSSGTDASIATQRTVSSHETGRQAATRAVLFDVDGTLYRQPALRRLMGAELARFVATRPVTGWRLVRVLRAYRAAQEELRREGPPYGPELQVDRAAERTGVQRRVVASMVDEWMHARPLGHLPRVRAGGLIGLLESFAARGCRLGVLSDYAAEAKLSALGVRTWFTHVWTAADPDVRALKPSPRGFLLAAATWQLDPGQVLVVGDRHDADGDGAAAAGMRAVIIGRRPASCVDLRRTFVSSLEQVISVIDDCC